MDELLLRNQVLGLLRSEDEELLLNAGFRRAYERGDVLFSAGEKVDRFHLVETGVLRLEEPGGGDVRYLRAGQALGSTCLLHERPSQHTVRVHEDAITISLTPKELDWLMEAEPAIAARLLRALATAVAGRSADAPVGAGARPEPPPAHAEPTGLARFAQVCQELREALAALGEPPEEGQAHWARERVPAVATAYRPVLRAMAALLNDAPPADRDALVQAARAHLLEIGGTSRLVERMHTRPTGRSAGYRGFNHIYRNIPEGDDTAGLLTDAWLISRPFAEAIRERRVIANERVAREVLDRARPDRVVRILSLGCGPARSLADLLEEEGMAEKMSITCVDDDQEALVHANNLLKSRAPRGDITFRQGSPADLTPDAPGYGGYDLVASLYSADNADGPSLGRICFTAHRWLHAHGVLTLVVFGDAVPDWPVLEVLLDWRPQHHSVRELQDVLARSPFGQPNSEVQPTPSGLNVFLRAVK